MAKKGVVRNPSGKGLDHTPGLTTYDKARIADRSVAGQIANREKEYPWPKEPGAQMRYVFGQRRGMDLTNEEKALRRWLDTKPMEYRNEMLRLEAIEEEKKKGLSQPESPAVAKPDTDPTGEKLCELIDSLLAKLGEGL